VKLLLDESLPQDLRLHLSDHEAVTVPFRGWASKRNGELLRLASPEFDVFITADQNLEHQQNIGQFEIAVVILVAPSNRLADLMPLLPKVLGLLASVRPGRIYRVSV
jgi:predicted nuclease of predicted toxin-antitoxin system